MRLSTKHPNQQRVAYTDFSGGLNTTSAVEALAQNELAVAINVCLDKSTGLLRTVDGTDTLLSDGTKEFDCLMCDPSDNTILVTDLDGNVYKVGNTLTKIGDLTGTNHASYATWKDGLVIASGGKLQYFHGSTLETISESPEACNGVFVRDGRVWTWHDDRIVLSGVGDEHSWTHDNNNASSSQYVDIGYKDRGNIKGIVALSSDVVVFKDNGHAYHLMGQYPDWQVKSIGRQIGIKSYGSCLSVGNSVLVLGDGKIQQVSVTDDYGEMSATDISRKVKTEVSNMAANVRMRYVSGREEVWFLEEVAQDAPGEFLVLDVARGAFFHRRYNSVARDVCTMNEETYILKEHGLCKISSDNKMEDGGIPMEWKFALYAMPSYNQSLLKRAFVDTTPYFDTYCDQRFKIGDVLLYGSLPETAKSIWHNYAYVCGSKRYICDPWTTLVLTDTAEEIYNNDEYIWKKRAYVRPIRSYRAETRCVDRRRTIPVKGRGRGGVVIFNQIALDFAEV